MGGFFFFPLPFSLFFFLLFFFYSTFRPFYFIVLLHFLLFFFVPVLTSLLVIYTGRKCLYTLPFLYFPSMHYVFSAGQLVDGNFLNSYVSLFLFHFFIFFLLRPSRRHLALLYFPYLFYFMSSLYGISAFLFLPAKYLLVYVLLSSPLTDANEEEELFQSNAKRLRGFQLNPLPLV